MQQRSRLYSQKNKQISRIQKQTHATMSGITRLQSNEIKFYSIV